MSRTRPNMRTLQMQDTIDRQKSAIVNLCQVVQFTEREISAWLNNWTADALDRMRKDFVVVLIKCQDVMGAVASADLSINVSAPPPSPAHPQAGGAGAGEGETA